MNNDRLNFRVWDKKNKKYMENYASCSINESGVLHVHTFGQHYELENTEDFEVEQCTGLKDKNGNLIYESDYVKANDVIYRVFWNKTKISLVNILNGDIIDISETITMEIVGNEHKKDNISEIPKNPKRSSD